MSKISIVLPTYNRPHLLPKAIDSILNQTYDDFEFIIVNNGSTKETAEILDNYARDPRVKVITLEQNIGFAAACNLGFDAISGDWFTIMSDDDSLLPHALARLISVKEIDPNVSAVSCNCISIHTQKFTGHGLHQTGYYKGSDIIRLGSGEFWGITRIGLLGDLRLNPKVSDDVSHLWYQIDVSANRYYLHEGLKYYDDKVGGRVSSPSRFRLPRMRAEHYKNLYEETPYWEIMREFAPKKYRSKLIKACTVLHLVYDVEYLAKYQALLQSEKLNLKEKFMMAIFRNLPRKMAYSMYTIIPA